VAVLPLKIGAVRAVAVGTVWNVAESRRVRVIEGMVAKLEEEAPERVKVAVTELPAIRLPTVCLNTR